MVLSDRTIKEQITEGRIVIDPLSEDSIQPASVDLHLDRHILVFRNNRVPYIDIRSNSEKLTELVTIGDDDPFMLHPGEFVLGSTLEHVEVPDDLVARLEGKSSLGRIGLLIHSTAGYVDPGWQGNLTFLDSLLQQKISMVQEHLALNTKVKLCLLRPVYQKNMTRSENL